jgi:hypothetical protein
LRQIGSVVVLTFAALWGPFCLTTSAPNTDEDGAGGGGGCVASLLQVYGWWFDESAVSFCLFLLLLPTKL